MWPLLLIGLGVYAYYRYTHQQNPSITPGLANGAMYAFEADDPLSLDMFTITLTQAGMTPMGAYLPAGVSKYSGIFRWDGANTPVIPELNGVTFTSIQPVL